MELRILNILQSPPQIYSLEDKNLLETAVQTYPYMQALQVERLRAIYQIEPHIATEFLGKVAAYTTDKRQLYFKLHPKDETVRHKEINNDIQIKKDSDRENADSKEIVFEKKSLKSIDQPVLENTDEINLNKSSSTIQEIVNEPLDEEKLQQSFDLLLHKYAPKEEVTKSNFTSEEKESIMTEDNPDRYNSHIEYSEPQEAEIEEKHCFTRDTSSFQQPQILPNPEIEEIQASAQINDTQYETPECFHDTLKRHNEKLSQTAQSNVPDFMFTWKTWLQARPKIDLVDKASVIDRFLEVNPKITPRQRDNFQEEKTFFTEKEEKVDLSHLMTDTLAAMYMKQKNWDKARDAYNVLQKKYPEKYTFYQEKLNEIERLSLN